jgi:hypothetical protein
LPHRTDMDATSSEGRPQVRFLDFVYQPARNG